MTRLCSRIGLPIACRLHNTVKGTAMEAPSVICMLSDKLMTEEKNLLFHLVLELKECWFKCTYLVFSISTRLSFFFCYLCIKDFLEKEIKIHEHKNLKQNSKLKTFSLQERC